MSDQPVPTIHAAAEAIRTGEKSPVDLLDLCLQQIERYEPSVKAWVFLDADYAQEQAKAREAEARAGAWRGPLHGIPIGIKDIFDVFDWPTAAGSKLWAQSIARRDAIVVDRLRRAGAVFLGKTVTTQYASFDPPPTRNPWKMDRTPGGSSSGSAAAVACGMCLGAMASQTGGSITRPAAFCGVPSCKPTFGRVCLDGIVPLAPSMDHPGPMARCVRDLAILLQVIQGPDARDSHSCSQPAFDLVARLEPTRPRLGRLRGLFEEKALPETRQMLDDAAARLRSEGAEICEVALPASFAEVLPRHRTVMAVEAAAFHEPRLRRHPDDYGPNITRLLQEGISCLAPEYAHCKDHQRQLRQEMAACFAGVDALLTPAAIGPAPDAATTGDPAFNSPWSYTGLPTVSVPAAFTPDGLPLSIQLIGPHWSEPRLLATAAWCEQTLALASREPPV